jgi:hypothetical protein
MTNMNNQVSTRVSEDCDILFDYIIVTTGCHSRWYYYDF